VYITANWLYQPKTEVRGLNVDIHLNPGGVLTGSMVKLVLGRAKRAVLDSYVPIVPMPFEVVLEDKKFLGVFGTNLGIMTEAATGVIFRMLGGAITEALRKNRDKFKEERNMDIWDHLRKEAAATRLELDQALAERAKLEESQRRLSAKICANRRRLSAADEAHSKACGELDFMESKGSHE
jgi:hypothetical protein